MLKEKTRKHLRIVAVMLIMALSMQSVSVVAESVYEDNNTYQWLIEDTLTATTYSEDLFNKYQDNSLESNTSEIISYNEFGEMDYTYALSGSVGDATATLNLCYWDNTADLGNAPYAAVISDGAEAFVSAENGTNFMDSVYGFGTGWSLDIPQIEYVNETAAYLHTGEGKAYRIGAVEPTEEDGEVTYKLCGFPYDYTLEKYITYSGEEDTTGALNGFVGTDRYGNKYYFNLDGRFVKSEDKNGTVQITVTYDEDKLIASLSDGSYIVNFVREQNDNNTQITIELSVGENNGTIGVLSLQSGNLASITSNSQSEESYKTEDETVAVTASSSGENIVTFDYDSVKLAIINDSEVSTVESSIGGYDYLVLSKITLNSTDRTDYTYAAVNSDDTEAQAKAEQYAETTVPYTEQHTNVYDIALQKSYKFLGVQSAQRSSVVSGIEYNNTSIVNDGYDPASPDNDEETVTTPTDETTTENMVSEFVYQNDKVVSYYSYTVPTEEDEELITDEAVLFDYSVDEEVKTETEQRVEESIASMVTVSNAEYTKETTDAQWVLDETKIEQQSKTGRNASGDIVYNSSNENTVFYKYNSNGSPVIEDVENGLKYLYTYADYEELTKTEFDIYTINYSDNSIESIYVNDTALISYDYSADKLNSETYANGQSLWYNYDSNGNVTEVFSGDETDENKLFSYTYSEVTDVNDQEPQLLTVTDYKNNLRTEYTYETSEDNETVISVVFDISDETPVELYRYTTDNTSETLSLGGSTLTNTFINEKTYVTNEDGEQEESGETNTSSIVVAENTWYNINTNDTEGVFTNSEVKNGDTTLINTGYTYDDEGRLSSETANGTTLTYTYDDNDNITAISNGTNTVEYVYDEKSQLVCANDQFNNKTYVYEYDSRGNILSKKEYAYTTEEDLTVLTPTKTDNYTYYSNEGINWQDELATFNGNTLTYDEGGNLSSYNGYTYTWVNGRQLAEISNGTNTYSYSYNDNGIRTSKTVNGVTTNYITNNGTILAEYNDSYSINYWYNEIGNPLGFIYKDKTLGEPTEQVYIYTRNKQGDITGIVDSTGAEVVSYSYDAWGSITDISGTLSATIGNINGLRYRGYYFDSETNYYYLQSRYYNPVFLRFINADDVEYINSNESNKMNLFFYCDNDSINYIDPMGMDRYATWVLDIVAFGFLDKGRCSSAMQAYMNGTVFYNEKFTEKLYNKVKKWWAKNGKYSKIKKYGKITLFNTLTKKKEKFNFDKYDMDILAFANYMQYYYKFNYNVDYIKAMLVVESNMGFGKQQNNGDRDIMQCLDADNPAIYCMAKKKPPSKSEVGYDKNEGLRYGIPINGFLKLHKLFGAKQVLKEKKVTPEISLCFGIFWLGYKTKLSNNKIKKGIIAYNGGGDPNYYTKIKKCDKDPCGFLTKR